MQIITYLIFIFGLNELRRSEDWERNFKWRVFQSLLYNGIWEADMNVSSISFFTTDNKSYLVSASLLNVCQLLAEETL